jgi:lipopolysaccharide transport system permease protein
VTSENSTSLELNPGAKSAPPADPALAATSASEAARSESLAACSECPRSNAQAADWDLVLRPKTGWFEIHLFDLWRYRDLTMLFVWRDFVSQYKQTVLGPLWHIIQPLFTTLLFTLIFGKVAKLSTDGLPPMLFYMAGITCWSYFAECLNRSAGTFINNASIFGKVYFPRLCVPLSIVISNIIKFGIQFALFLCFMAIYWFRGEIHPRPFVLLLPLLVVIMAALGLGLGIIVSALTVRYRDLQVLITFGVQLMMYATPVIYPLSKVPEDYRWLVLANPMSAIVETFRYAFLGKGEFDSLYLLYSGVSTLVILLIGIVLFNHVERTFMDTV